MDVGRRLSAIRKKAGLSQRELAKRAGVTNSTISMIEKNSVSPSVGSLKKVLSGVPISLLEFFDTEESTALDVPVVYRAADFRDASAGNVTMSLIGQHYPNRAMNLLTMTYPPGADSGDDHGAQEGEQSGVVISGKIELTLDGEVYIVAQGEGYYFSSTRRHRFRNPFNENCRLVSATTPAGF